MKVQHLMIVSFILILCLSSCNGQISVISGDNEPSMEGKTVIVTPAIGPNSAELQVGDTLEIQLATIPSEGFDWVVEEIDTKILVQEGSAVYKADTSPDLAGGIVSLEFKLVGTGRTSLTLAYVSEPTDETPSFTTKTFGMTVTVTEKVSEVVVITPDIKDNSASLQVGDTLEIQIPTIPTEGYEWVVEELDRTILVQEGNAVYTADTSPDLAGGMVKFGVKAVGKGETGLVLEYVTSASDDNSTPTMSMDSFGVIVEVK